MFKRKFSQLSFEENGRINWWWSVSVTVLWPLPFLEAETAFSASIVFYYQFSVSEGRDMNSLLDRFVWVREEENPLLSWFSNEVKLEFGAVQWKCLFLLITFYVKKIAGKSTKLWTSRMTTNLLIYPQKKSTILSNSNLQNFMSLP